MTTSPGTAPDPELLEAMGRFDRCIRERDQAAADGVLAEDYALVLVQPTPASIPRARWLEVLPDYVVHELETEESIVREHGDLALVLHRDRMRATVLGQDRSGTFVITDVWRRTADGWRLQERHSTPSSAGALPGA